MIKLVALIKRRADITIEEFRDHYENHHAQLFHRSIPPEVAAAIKRYEQDHAVVVGRSTPPYDCVTQFTFDDLDGCRRWSDWYRGDGAAELRQDEEDFMDTSQRVVLITEVHDLSPAR